MNAKVLIADEEPMFLRAIAYILQEANFLTVTASDCEHVLWQVRSEKPDLIILSATLPNFRDTQICCALRHDTEQPFTGPILMLSERGGEDDKVDALECGVTDYLVKPFGIREFMARAHALLRNNYLQDTENKNNSFYGGGIILNTATREVYFEAEGARREVYLSHKEFNLLHFLMMQRGEIVSRETIMQHIWPDNPAQDCRDNQKTNTIDTHIRRLRLKLERDPANPEHILTVINAGYRFKSSMPSKPETKIPPSING